MIKVSLISLGCAKNLVDSEIMVGHLHQAGMTVIPEAEKADVVIVNTCSFIDSSKEESIGHILEVHQNKGMKKRRKEQKLIVAGCMSQRFSKDLSSELHHEVDAFIGLGYEESLYDYSYYVPTQESWDNGDREVTCVAYADDASQITGTLKGINS